MRLHEGFLEACRELYKSGNHWALMQSIMCCARDEEPLPKWAAEAYIKAFETVSTGGAKSWDDVFGKPHPKGAHMNAIKKQAMTMWPLHSAVLEAQISCPGEPLEALFERVGKRFGVGRTLAAEYYFRAKALMC